MPELQKKTKIVKKVVKVKKTVKAVPAAVTKVAKEEAVVAKVEPTTVAAVAAEAEADVAKVEAETKDPVSPPAVPSEEVKEVTVCDDFKSLLSVLSQLGGAVKSAVTDMRKLEKRVIREQKEASKKSRKRVNTALLVTDKPKRAPSGFAKPSDISQELCVFLEKPVGTQMARTEVTRYVTAYIKNHCLQNPENKRHIIPDQKLKKLLNSQTSDEVTYFNLQKYMKHHYPKSVSCTTSTAASIIA